MISSPEEFKRLRESNIKAEYARATEEVASIDIWHEVLKLYPGLAFWVAQNKTVPLEILEVLADNQDVKVREMVARKRKISSKIFNKLKEDPDESIRYALMCNTKLSYEQKLLIKTNDSEWLRSKLKETLAQKE